MVLNIKRMALGSSYILGPLANLTRDFDAFGGTPMPIDEALAQLIDVAQKNPDEFKNINLPLLKKKYGLLPTIQTILNYIETDLEAVIWRLGSQHQSVSESALTRLKQEKLNEDQEQSLLYHWTTGGSNLMPAILWLAQTSTHEKTIFSILEFDNFDMNKILVPRLQQFPWSQDVIDQFKEFHPSKLIREKFSMITPSKNQESSIKGWFSKFYKNKTNP